MIFFIVSKGYFQGSEAQSGKVRGCVVCEDYYYIYFILFYTIHIFYTLFCEYKG